MSNSSAPAASRLGQHEAVARVATAQYATKSSFTNGVSVHKMNQSVSFNSLRAVLKVAVGHQHRCFVGTIDGTVILSVNFNYETPKSAPARGTSKKRGRDPNEDAVDAALERVRRNAPDSSEVSEEMAEAAKQALLNILNNIRGPDGERPIESWGLLLNNKNSQSESASRPQLVISARITPGVAVPTALLLKSLGARCCADGMLTTQNSTALADGFQLPLSDQASVAESHGQKALTLFATVSKTA